MARVVITNEESWITGVRLIKELVFNDQTAQAEIKLDYFYLLRLVELIMDRIPPESLDKDDSLGEALVRQLVIEVNQLTEKLAGIEHECVKETVIKEAEDIVRDVNV